MDLFPYLNYVLKNKGEAIVPGLGVFRLLRTEARHDEHSGLFHPPGVNLSFTPDTGCDDDEIISLISLHKKISRDMAEEYVGKAVGNIQESLKNKLPFFLKEMGELSVINDNEVVFTVDKNSPLVNEFYGLPHVELTAENKNEDVSPQIIETEAKGMENQEIKKVKSKKRKRIFLVLLFFAVTAGAICFIVNFHSASFYVNQKFKIINDQIRQILSKDKKTSELIIQEKGKNQTPPIAEEKNRNDTMKKTILVHKDTVKTFDVMNYIIEPADVKKFFIIAGCFKDLINAEKMVKELEDSGYSPVIAGKTPQGLYRVCYTPGFSDKSGALEEMKKIRSELNNEPWLITY